MANMSYCRFENTARDLQDCLDALNEAPNIEVLEDDASENERPMIRHLIELCKQVADMYYEA